MSIATVVEVPIPDPLTAVLPKGVARTLGLPSAEVLSTSVSLDFNENLRYSFNKYCTREKRKLGHSAEGEGGMFWPNTSNEEVLTKMPAKWANFLDTNIFDHEVSEGASFSQHDTLLPFLLLVGRNLNCLCLCG